MQTMAIFYIHRVGFGHGPQAKSRRWFLEQALDKVALTAEGGPRRFQGWDSAAVSTSERLRATADRAGRQVNSNVSTTLSVHTTQCITTVGAAGAALPRRARDSFLRFLYSINSLSVISFVRLSVRSFKGSAPLPTITVVPAVSWSPRKSGRSGLVVSARKSIADSRFDWPGRPRGSHRAPARPVQGAWQHLVA